ncbi:2',3'-cyclic-nucleotide 2'-phosphodiesterase [Paenibacillus rhizosphaerae]|uniref:2',3'-cyclic-nucleotide 2'-phosphodiesterase n=1 Tax=Paenibacillus rhizosphaerae TaxID=297318 RepID=A0A1R1EL50_9BACL|nr:MULTISPECIES: bifunctional 2',3'-cyclic-nucleotide 2'-phosphodiesterase/3'-nucleotidase [Paenibacillus]OMF52541.1 2',3'-cyclic-nucleotide 2'-phosphodiesterase [Paenibacillus rhizosphaerae]UYO05973.1 bifunctional 2',3'-cyclic-nucleotide 2'-phosphodiesterase/3'-nucleotidase [Paenibacillus sp. PSB04]
MSKSRKKVLKGITAAAVAINVLAVPMVPVFADSSSNGSKVKLRIMETSDLHVNMVNYDYYADKPTDEYGFAKTASLIKAARNEAKNSLLFDNGDLIQGNPLGDYVAKVKPLKEGEVHPVYKAMDLMDYDAGGVGNHEFNYGLDFLKLSEEGANFPIVNANVYKDDGDKDDSNDVNYFTPYTILDKKVTDENGKEQTIKVGVIAFVPPQISQWDKANLEGKVIVKDMVETAKKFIPQMKKEGADVIVAIPHSGFEDIPETPLMENTVLYLSKVEGIDAILFGHAHKTFPSAEFKGKTGVDLEKGTINGVPAVEPGFWGDHLGIIDLNLENVDGKWKVVDSKTEARPIYDTANKKALVDADQEIVNAVKTEHDATIDYVRGPVGKTSAPINSYFALVQDDPSIQIVTNAQKWYVEKNLKGTEYENLPVLSAGAPFKAGGRNGASYYTNIPAGTIAIKNVSDLYVYPNTVHAVVVTGAEVKEWLEWSAGQFNQIDPSKTTEQPLVNMDFPTYNYDVIDGVTYQIDVTQPNKYDAKGTVVNPSANRIKNLQFDGKPIDLKQKFVVATNNYRASSSKLANPDGKRIIMAAPDENRQVIIDYIRDNGTINPSADGNWTFAPVDAKLNVTFTSSPDAKDLAASSKNMKYIGAAEDGFAKYGLDLSVSTAGTAPVTPPATTPETPSKPSEPSTPAQPSKPSTPSKPAPAPETKPSGKVYVIKKGDNLYRIGIKFGVDWKTIAHVNGITNVHGLKVGQQIMIP